MPGRHGATPVANLTRENRFTGDERTEAARETLAGGFGRDGPADDADDEREGRALHDDGENGVADGAVKDGQAQEQGVEKLEARGQADHEGDPPYIGAAGLRPRPGRRGPPRS